MKYSLDGRVIPTINGFKEYDNKGKGNPYHDKLGRFTTGPSGSGKSSGGSSTKNTDDEIKKTKKEIEELGDFLESVPPSGVSSSEAEAIDETWTRLEKAKKKLEKLEGQKREAEKSKAKAEREEHIKQIDKIIGNEKITEGKTKAEDDKNYKKLEKDVLEIQRILSKEKSRENFGQEEIRKLKDKYSDYMSGNWSTVGRFMGLIRDLEDWADNYPNY